MYELSSVIYRINPRDEIVFVNERWNVFASGNNSLNLMKQEVLGQSIWNFISDFSTRDLYQQLVASVRRGEPVHFKFRCDSPERRRYMEMNIRQLKDKKIQFESRTVFTEERPFQKLLDRDSPRSDNMVVVCSFCKKVNSEEDIWVDVEDAVRILDIFDKEEMPTLSHGICMECYGPFMTQIAHSATNN